MLPDAPCGRRESPHSRPSLLLPLPSPPESNEPAPHSRGIPPRAAPPASTSRSAPRRLPERPQFGKTSLPALQSPALRPVPSPRPPSRTFSPQPRPFAPSPAIFSLRPSNRPPFPRVPAPRLPPRPADLPGVRLRQASRAALRACVSRVSAEVDLSAQTARKPPRSPHFRSVPATDECSARYEFKTKKARRNPGLEICGAEGQN